jgi:hypothetical protein
LTGSFLAFSAVHVLLPRDLAKWSSTDPANKKYNVIHWARIVKHVIILQHSLTVYIWKMDIVQVCRSKDMILPCYQLNIDIVCVWVCLCSNVRMNEEKTVTAILDFLMLKNIKFMIS